MGEVLWSDVKKIAQNEIGYEEGPNNWTKYARDLDAINYFNGPKQNVAWCATFTSWCIWKAADPDPKGTALAAQYQPKRDNCGCGVSFNAGYYKNAGEFYSTPKEGDVFFTDGYNHTGWVASLNSDGSFDTIEGNHNNKVDTCTRWPGDMEGFGRPWWTPEPEPSPSGGYPGEFPTRPDRGYFQRYDTGEEVKKLQQLCLWFVPGCLPQYGVDGEIGSETLNAVKLVQRVVGVTVDGFYGKDTEAACKAYRR